MELGDVSAKLVASNKAAKPMDKIRCHRLRA
jgi:hypothetical protein